MKIRLANTKLATSGLLVRQRFAANSNASLPEPDFTALYAPQARRTGSYSCCRISCSGTGQANHRLLVRQRFAANADASFPQPSFATVDAFTGTSNEQVFANSIHSLEE